MVSVCVCVCVYNTYPTRLVKAKAQPSRKVTRAREKRAAKSQYDLIKSRPVPTV